LLSSPDTGIAKQQETVLITFCRHSHQSFWTL